VYGSTSVIFKHLPSYIGGLYSNNESGFALFVRGNASGSTAGRLIFEDYYAPSQAVRATIVSPNSINLNTWNHVVITINKATGIHVLYLNDVVIGTVTSTNNSILTNPKVVIGNTLAQQWAINGKIDDVRIYNRALDSAEVSQLYTSTIPPLSLINKTICKGDSVSLNPGSTVSGSYSWSPTSTLNNYTLVNPIASPPVTTKYYATIEKGGCYATDSVTVQIDTINLSASDESVCLSDSINLSATGASSYLWTPSTGLSDPSIANPLASPSKTMLYIVKGTSGVCTSYDTAIVTVCDCSKTIIYDTIKNNTNRYHYGKRHHLDQYI
jgi:hypothetical protein